MATRTGGGDFLFPFFFKRGSDKMPYTNSFNELFATKPMELFRRHAVVPPGTLGGQATQQQAILWTDTEGVVTGGARSVTADVRWSRVPVSEGVVRIDFAPSTGNEKGALTFRQSDSGVPVYFLPWDSLRVVSLAIPDAGGAFYEPDDPDYPGLFFTAAINGCSIFAKGSPTRPEVFHGGIDGDFAAGTSAVDFWESRVEEILAAQGPGGGHMGAVRSVNKTHYIKDPTNADPTTTATAQAYETWLTSNQATDFRVQIVNPWACVFGIRYGRSWTFYLQENATATILRYVKKSATQNVQVNAARQERQLKATGDLVQTETVRKSLGPISWNSSIYLARQTYSRPLQIREFFPNGETRIQVKESVSRL